MALSQKTIDEMRAGAMAVAKAAGADGIDAEYMEAIVRTGVRAAWLGELSRAGKIKLDRELRRSTNNQLLPTKTVVWVGDERFEDPVAEVTGAWPSEVLCARVTLALGAGLTSEDKDNG